MQMTEMIEVLRIATSEEHRELDRLLLPIVQRIRTFEEYADLLALFYGFMNPMQERIDPYLDDRWVSDYSLRRRPTRILDDIKIVSHKTSPLPLCVHLPKIENVGQALAAYYVLEGSTLGGPAICRIISGNLQLKNNKGFSFFAGYGENNLSMWQNFVVSLSQVTSAVADYMEVAETACLTFSSLKNWIIDSYEQRRQRKTFF